MNKIKELKHKLVVHKKIIKRKLKHLNKHIIDAKSEKESLKYQLFFLTLNLKNTNLSSRGEI